MHIKTMPPGEYNVTNKKLDIKGPVIIYDLGGSGVESE